MISQNYTGPVFFFFWLLLVGPVLLNGCDNSTPSDTTAIDTRPAATVAPPEQSLATIDAGTQTPADDPIIVKYKVLLDDLSETYSAKDSRSLIRPRKHGTYCARRALTKLRWLP